MKLNCKKRYYFLVAAVFLFIVILGVFLFFKPSKDLKESFDFCGKPYLGEDVSLNDIKVLDVLEKIVNKDEICFALERNFFTPNIISVETKQFGENEYLVVLYHKNNDAEYTNPFYQSPFIFKFDFKNRLVYSQSAFDGSFVLEDNF